MKKLELKGIELISIDENYYVIDKLNKTGKSISKEIFDIVESLISLKNEVTELK